MRRRLLIASILGLSVLAFALIGGPQAAQEPPAAAPEPAEEPALEGPPGGEPLETFEPTEKLSADSAVSFPVDI